MKKIFKSPVGQEETISNFRREIYDENEYDNFGVKVEKGDIVLDCGANVGIFSQYAIDMGASLVYAYESDELNEKYYIDNVETDKSIFTRGYVGHNNYDLEKIFNQHQINHIDFAKVDIEGAEWEMFKNIDINYFNLVDKWAIEFHTSYYNENTDDKNKANRLWDFLSILEIFSSNNYKIYYKHIHKGWDIVHLYAKK